MNNAYDVVKQFEECIALYAGSKYAVAVESCSAAILLSLDYKKRLLAEDKWKIEIPKFTYPSVAFAIMHIHKYAPAFSDEQWEGTYDLKLWYGHKSIGITDGALRFKRGMYKGGLHCLSFHAKKHLQIGRGGMILTDDEQAYKWLKKARFDGRDECSLADQKDIDVAGWNAYMTPEQAARGLELFNMIKDKDLPDLRVEDQDYPDLSKFTVFNP